MLAVRLLMLRSMHSRTPEEACNGSAFDLLHAQLCFLTVVQSQVYIVQIANTFTRLRRAIVHCLEDPLGGNGTGACSLPQPMHPICGRT